MFTGIIEEVGTVAELVLPEGEAAGRVRIEAAGVLSKISVGASITVNGCCLTVRKVDAGGFWCDLSPETLSRTSFRQMPSGARVNLEAPLMLSSPLGGHFVQGHVDATGTVVAFIAGSDGDHWLEVEVPAEWTRYVVEKGSVAIEGISLTVAALEGSRLR
ncbi:MAG: riboflavin synthase, partial [Candidatus Acidiferrales bacterium]